MGKGNERKAAVLGMPHGTAAGQLRKQLLYKYVKNAGDHFCYKCGAEIESVNDLSIEHKLPWESTNRPDLFWDIDNIAFSHLKCNRPHVNGAEKLRRIGPEGTAWCGYCKQFLPVDRFRERSETASGYEYRCRDCRNQAKKELSGLKKSSVVSHKH